MEDPLDDPLVDPLEVLEELIIIGFSSIFGGVVTGLDDDDFDSDFGFSVDFFLLLLDFRGFASIVADFSFHVEAGLDLSCCLALCST